MIGNLPYNISTPLLFHLAAAHESIVDLHVMLQKEVIDRIAAAPDSDDYGRLTVMLAPWFEAKHLFDVGPRRIHAAAARLVRGGAAHGPARTRIRVAPGIRANGISRLLASTQDSAQCVCARVMDLDAIVAAGIDPGVRPETLSPADFARLAAQVQDT